MKKFPVALLLFIFCFRISAQQNIDVLHYRFHLGVNDVNDTIYGLALIDFKALEKTKRLEFDLIPRQANGKGMEVISVFRNDPKAQLPVYKIENEKLLITGNDYEKNETATIIISYKGIPDDGFIISKNKFGRRTFFADNWPNRARHWLPCKDDPADKASAEFIITAPDKYQVVANGVQIEESTVEKGYKTTHWKEDIPLPTKVMTVGIAEFNTQLIAKVNDCIPVYSWSFPEQAKEAVHDYKLTKGILEYYIQTIGPYGYKKLANVQSKTRFGGLENASTIFYGENTVTGNGNNESLLAHETAHQWFGNMITEKSFGHLWLSEGFATYFTTLYFENKYGKDTAAYLRMEDRDQVIGFSKENNTAAVNTAETNYMKLLNVNSYQKGGWALHMLRRYLGDSIFFKSIRKYYASYAGKNADTEDWQAICESVSSKNLKQFFKQWLYTHGQPDLKIRWKYNAKSKNIEITVEQLQKDLFVFPLEMLVQFSSGRKMDAARMIEKRIERFTIGVKEKPVALIADPEINLLFTGAVEEIRK